MREMTSKFADGMLDAGFRMTDKRSTHHHLQGILPPRRRDREPEVSLSKFGRPNTGGKLIP